MKVSFVGLLFFFAIFALKPQRSELNCQIERFEIRQIQTFRVKCVCVYQTMHNEFSKFHIAKRPLWLF